MNGCINFCPLSQIFKQGQDEPCSESEPRVFSGNIREKEEEKHTQQDIEVSEKHLQPTSQPKKSPSCGSHE
ncbi:hypothetical protein VNO80_04918 [Phaseolus coccineus]|uniref:Uncharacterized protein n=1 Tax=Phaseolus coccineus TaxID=3886 RepID=A0AAN9RPP3_PHACN